MSTELDRTLARLYAALGDEAQVTPLTRPEELRRRSDRARTRRAVVSGVAASLLVAGTVAGGAVLLDDGPVRITPAPPPTGPVVNPRPLPTSPSPTTSPSSTPSVTVSVTTSPSVSATGAPVSTDAPPQGQPTSVPDGVFLTQAEVNSGSKPTDLNGAIYPLFCNLLWGEAPTVRRIVGSDLRQPGADVTTAPDVQLRQAVVLMGTPAQARNHLAEARGTVDACRTEQVASGTARYSLVTNAPLTGADVVVIRKQTPRYDLATGEATGGYDDFYTAMVRHGDTIAILHTEPHENWGVGDPKRFYELAQTFANRVAAWRGDVPE